MEPNLSTFFFMDSAFTVISIKNKHQTQGYLDIRRYYILEVLHFFILHLGL